MKWLFEAVPEHKRIEIAAKITDQEMALQESIRNHEYRSSIIDARVRNFLTFAIMGSTLLLFGLVIVTYMANGRLFGLSVDKGQFDTITGLLKVTFVGWVAIILGHFFSKR